MLRMELRPYYDRRTQEYLVVSWRPKVLLTTRAAPMIGVRTELQKYVHDWYPYPEWGGANQGVYPKGEYGKGLSKGAEISVTLRARQHAKCWPFIHSRYLRTMASGQKTIAEISASSAMPVAWSQHVRNPLWHCLTNRRVTGGGGRARPYTGEDTLKPTLYPITLSPVRELDRG